MSFYVLFPSCSHLIVPQICLFYSLLGGGAEASGGAEDSGAVAEGSAEEGDKDGKKPKKNRCHECRKKVGLTGGHAVVRCRLYE